LREQKISPKKFNNVGSRENTDNSKIPYGDSRAVDWKTWGKEKKKRGANLNLRCSLKRGLEFATGGGLSGSETGREVLGGDDME